MDVLVFSVTFVGVREVVGGENKRDCVRVSERVCV